MSGCAPWKPAMRGISQCIITDDEHDSVSGPGLSRSTLSWIRRKAAASPSARRAPSAVVLVAAPARSSKATPSCSSSARRWRLTAPWVTKSSAAAADMLPRRAVASKARRALSDGLGVAVDMAGV